MLFNSIDFAIFLPIIFGLYWFILNGNLRLQNLFIVLASYLFYGWWDWRFLMLIFFSTTIDYVIGLQLSNQENPKKRKLLLWASIVINVGFLGFFKYFNFFLESFVSAFLLFGNEISVNSIEIILPVGISFYTFQTLSYTIDVYKRKLKPTDNFIAYMAFVSFFPQLVAGPIERATNLLPQFHTKRNFNYDHAVDGLRQMLWGLFKKIVVADNCAVFANLIFNNSSEYMGSTLLIGVLFFTIQVYCDFSGYSDIAIGVSRLFGFNLKQNFATPFFSRDIAEFWRRWHISLSTWFRDYLYIPLGGSKGSMGRKFRNTFIIFLVSGFWHGANWTFIVWGALNALYFLPLILSNKNRKYSDIVAQGKLLPSLKESFQMLRTVLLFALGLIFFRAENLNQAISITSEVFSPSLFTMPYFSDLRAVMITSFIVVVFFIIEWIGRAQKFAIAKLGLGWRRPIRHSVYYVLILLILWYGGKEEAFVYFQF